MHILIVIIIIIECIKSGIVEDMLTITFQAIARMNTNVCTVKLRD